jgi:thiamine biosynthesis lipoprotein
LLCLLATALHAQSQLQRFEFTRPEMGSVFRISMYAASESEAKVASDAAFTRVEALNQICSDYLPDSELIQLCRAGEMKVSDDLLSVVERSQNLARLTDGAFDISVGHLTNLWRRSRRKAALPSDEQLHNALALTDWRSVTVDSEAKRITLKKPKMQLDLGGIAKGFAADAALQVLKLRGIHSAVVAASGDLAVGAAPPGERGWEVSIRTFEAPEETDKLIKLRLQHCGISTSGDLHQSIEIGGQRYSHIVDPKTGLGLTNRIACSVIASDATTSDGLATAMCVLGVEKGMKVLESQANIEARFAEFSAQGSLRTTTTPKLPTTN